MPMQTDYSVAPAAAVAGQLASRPNDSDITSGFNAESSASIGFGLGVEYASSTEGKPVKLPNAETDKIKGITLRRHSIDPGERGELDDDGVKVGGTIDILKRGEVWVKVRTGCAPGDRLWVRAVASGSEWLGACENADDSTDTIDCTANGEFLTYAAANGLAKLRVNF